MKQIFINCRVIASLLLLAMVFYFEKANGSGIIYNFDTVFGASSVAPSGSAPWVQATFQDVTGGVLLTVNNVNLTSSEFVNMMYFNLNTNMDPTMLSFALQSTNGAFTIPTPTTFVQGAQVGGQNGNKADGDGYFDVLLNFAQSGTDSERFNAGESVSYLISGITGLTAMDFGYLSQGGGSSDYYAAAHIQGTGNGQKSAWVAPSEIVTVPVPEPAPAALLAASMGFWALLRLRSQRAKI